MLSVRNLQYRYSQSSFELNVPCFDMQAGQHTAITGPSGCGKTTFMNLLAGIIPPSSPVELNFRDEPLHLGNAKQMRVFRNESLGFVFQDFHLLNYLSLSENILLPVTLSSNTGREQWRTRADELIKRLGLEDLRERPVSKLSRGEQQRVAVCRALLQRPALVLADEPTANLDATNAAGVWELLFEQAQEIDATIIAVTHATEGLERFARVLSFEQLASGDTEDFG